jgi:hypothetical protein
MAPTSFLRFTIIMAPFLIHTSAAQTQTPPDNHTKVPTQKGVQFQLSPAKTPLVFEPNRGQAASNFQWIGRGAGFRLGIGNDGATLEFADRKATSPAKPKFLNPSDLLKPQAKPRSAPDTLVKLHLSGSNGWKPAGAEPSGGISNYFIGKTPAAWHTDIPQYAQVKVASVYQGVDLIFHGDESTLEYDFVIAPGADPRQIQLQFEGATSLEVDKANGDLVLETANKTELLRHAQPKIYQLVDGKQVPIKGGFQVFKGNTASFTIEKYDHAKSLVIDPTIRFVTFLGGSDTDTANAVAVDGRGFTYVTGQTYSGNFNVVGGVIQSGRSGDSDAFVTKLGTGGNIVFSTYLGGGDNDAGNGVAVDATGAYVAGQTHSDDFPLAQALQYDKKGDGTIFVTKLSPSGNRLVYSTYLGGSNAENGGAIAIDASQAAYVAGFTTSKDFPVVNGYEYYRGAAVSGFVSKIAPNGVSLVYSTYLGGSNVDSISGIAVDSSLSAYVTGEAASNDFPYAGYQSTMFGGSPSAFLTKLSPAGDSLIYSTSLSLETTIGTAVSLDPAGNAYVAGTFCSPCESPHPDFVFAAKVSPAGKLTYSRLFPTTDGSSDGYAIATDASGETWVSGSTSSTTFPGAPPLAPNPTAGFLMKLDENGNGPLYTIFLGASINAVAVTKPTSTLGQIVYPTIYTAGMRYTGGKSTSNQDAFVVKLDEEPVIINQP